MNIEIERKFIVTGEFKSMAFAHSHIEQGYFETAPGRTVRVRIRDEKAYLTIKGPSNQDGLSRYEFETEVSLEDGRHLMELCRPGRIEKVRWLVHDNDGKHTIEVDEFEGDNAGLIMAEIELGSEDEAYNKPTFLGMEVTGDRRFYNNHLMRYPYRLWGKAFETEELK